MRGIRKGRGSLAAIRGGGVAIVAVAVTLALGSPSSSATGDNPVVYWSEVAETAISAPTSPGGPPRPPAGSTPYAAMVHGAMYDAVAAVEGGLRPFVSDVSAPAGASVDAAVAQAARDVLVTRIPAQATAVQAAYDAFMAAIPASQAKQDGQAVGAAAAAAMLELRQGDGLDASVPYVQPTPGPGVFEPIAPTTPVDVRLASVRPFTFAAPSDYRPAPPYALTSKRYAEDVAEVQATGRATGSVRTDEQTRLVRFYTDPTYRQFSRALLGLVTSRGLDVRESAQLLGFTWVAVADTMIACWEAKYHYMFWRPNHAIQRADTDGNPATTPEAGWLPLVTGNHPEYPSGHACFTAGVTTSLHRYFGTKDVEVKVTSVVTGTEIAYSRLDDLVADVQDARVWGGLHYRTTMRETAQHFPRIARHVARLFLTGAGS